MTKGDHGGLKFSLDVQAAMEKGRHHPGPACRPDRHYPGPSIPAPPGGTGLET
jgi:hypothetical protein